MSPSSENLKNKAASIRARLKIIAKSDNERVALQSKVEQLNAILTEVVKALGIEGAEISPEQIFTSLGQLLKNQKEPSDQIKKES